MAHVMTMKRKDPDDPRMGSTAVIESQTMKVGGDDYPAAAFEAEFGFPPEHLSKMKAADLREFSAANIDLNISKAMKKDKAVDLVLEVAKEWLSEVEGAE